MKRLIISLIVIVVVIGLLIYFKPVDKTTVISPTVANKATPVEAMVVKVTPASNIIRISGNVMSNEEVNLQSQIAGVVTEVNFQEGSHINKGDLHIKIDDA